MQDQQVGDALVLIEGQAERWFWLAAILGVAVHIVSMTVDAIDAIDMPVNSICVAVYTVNAVHSIHSVGDIVSYEDKFALDETS